MNRPILTVIEMLNDFLSDWELFEIHEDKIAAVTSNRKIASTLRGRQPLRVQDKLD